MENGLLGKRLDNLVAKRLLRQKDATRFAELEVLMATEAGETSREMLLRFHESNDTYLPLLQKVLKGLVRVGEPQADEKLSVFLEELGTVGPAVFLAPWEMTLTWLDEYVGSLDEVRRFYSAAA